VFRSDFRVRGLYTACAHLGLGCGDFAEVDLLDVAVGLHRAEQGLNTWQSQLNTWQSPLNMWQSVKYVAVR